MSIAKPERSEQSAAVNLDPTIPAPMANATNVAEYGFEGRFADWADEARYFEYSKAANPIGSGHAPQVPIRQFGPEIYLDRPTGIVPLDLSRELGIKTGEATSPALLANFVRIRAGEQIDTGSTPPHSCTTCSTDGALPRWTGGWSNSKRATF
jgi:hypothetical protein